MGSVLGRTDGIVKDGVLTKLTCKSCGIEFQGYVGTITIKGLAPIPELCRTCYQIQQEKEMEKMLDHMKGNIPF